MPDFPVQYKRDPLTSYAAVYQSLYRLEARGLVRAAWRLSEKGRRARYYRLTPRGRTELTREAAAWRRYADVVGGIIEGSGGGS